MKINETQINGTTLNTQVPQSLWLAMFDRATLRAIAKQNGIDRGRNAVDTARNLSRGYGDHQGNSVIHRFEMHLCISL